MGRHGIKKWLDALGQVVFPNLCVFCSKEVPIRDNPFCVHCISDIPFTNHFEHKSTFLAQKFWGKIDIAHSAALLYFTKDSLVQEMIHRLKYNGKYQIGIKLGQYVGKKLQTSQFEQIDVIIPVPLHYRKQEKRGYNQAKMFGQGISEVVSIPLYDDVLVKISNTKSQTDKGREHRYKNVLDSFAVRQINKIKGKHVVLVDDVITTGATLEACARKIYDAAEGDIKISIISIAMARS